MPNNDAIDWEIYDETMKQLIKQAVETFVQTESDLVSQISIYTDIRQGCSGVDFETKLHALRHNSWRANETERQGISEIATLYRQRELNLDSGDFKYTEFATVSHPELGGLEQLNEELKLFYAEHDDNGLATTFQKLAQIEEVQSKRLQSVINQSLTTGAFDALPTESPYFIGSNSPTDWYDHILKVEEGKVTLQN